VSAVPAAAAEVKGTGFFAVWDDTDIVHLSGIVIVDRTDGTTPRYQVGGSGDRPMESLSINFRSIGCNGTPSQANRVFRIQLMTDANGGMYERGQLSPNLNFDAVRSVWIGSSDCVVVEQFERVATGDVNGDGALSIITDKATPKLIVAVQSVSNDEARVSIFVDGKNAGEEFSARGSNRPCGQSAGTAPWFVPDMDSDQSAMVFDSSSPSLTPTQVRSLRSVRLRSETFNRSWCAPAIIMANTEGDF
jgi:hypothetical protein